MVDLGREQVAVEIKSGETVAADFFAGLDFWRTLVGDPESSAALVTGGDRSYTRRGVQVYSWMEL